MLGSVRCECEEKGREMVGTGSAVGRFVSKCRMTSWSHGATRFECGDSYEETA